MSRVKEQTEQFHIGDNVRIKESIRSPYAGQTGTICDVENAESRSEYLVRFPDYLRFRYTAEELELITIAA